MLRSTVLLLFVSLTAAQVSRRCSCISRSLCNEARTVNTDCSSMYEVCCEVTSQQPTSPTPTGPTTRELQACGVRGNKTKAVKLRPEMIFKITDEDGSDIGSFYGEFPWMVAIMKKGQSENLEFFCAGSIIYPNVILTAAHSISNSTASDLTVRAGMWNNSNIEEAARQQDRTVSRIVMHPGYVRATAANDVALLVLKERLNITEDIAPVCLPTSQLTVNEGNCIATGWGSNSLYNKTIQSILKKVKLPMIDFNSCQSKMGEYFGEADYRLQSSALCAGGNTADTCMGDGGGPLMCSTTADENQFVQIGITSWGVKECGQGYPGVYADVRVVADWIETQARMFLTNIIPGGERLGV